MTNPVVNALKDIGNIIAWPFVYIPRTISILTATMTDYPAVRTAVVGLVQQCEALAADSATAIAAKGIDVPDDEATLTQAKTLYTYVTQTFLPAIEQAYNDEVNAAKNTAATTAAQAAAASAAAKKAAATRAAAKAQPSTTATTNDSAGTTTTSVDSQNDGT